MQMPAAAVDAVFAWHDAAVFAFESDFGRQGPRSSRQAAFGFGKGPDPSNVKYSM
jgi:hypothetical protein